ncbi:uncharacterized protein LOC127252911 [Andrographis paniculata]|uniref:uncharacterized protein LOC127252911 n=1 Tax=Andrographis paniculata TaxID=175694 RepID=UPI0021E7E659|nr:uncharacterized protein LOC127252911 [Andrographis paniculata]
MKDEIEGEKVDDVVDLVDLSPTSNKSQCQVPSQSNSAIRPAKKSQRANKNWSIDEDVELTNAWCNVPAKAQVGVGQKKIKLWERVCENFVKRMEDKHKVSRLENERTPGGCENRWMEIRSQCIKWSAIRVQTQPHYHSGWSPTDFDQYCRTRYLTKHESNFKCEASWHILKDHPKWMELVSGKKCKVSGQSSTFAKEVIGEANEVQRPVQGHSPVTPIDSSSGAVRIHTNSSEKGPNPSELGGPAAIDMEHPVGACNKSNDERQQKIQRHEESQVQVPSKSNLVVGPVKKNQRANKNWSIDEDVELTTAWCNVPTDVRIGVGQKLWERVCENFVVLMENNHKVSRSENIRTPGGCENRLMEIRTQCSKWSAIRVEAQQHYRSACCSANFEEYCRKTYFNQYQSNFKCEACWNILKDHPKWMEFVSGKLSKISGWSSTFAKEVVGEANEVQTLVEGHSPFAPIDGTSGEAHINNSSEKNPSPLKLGGPIATDLEHLIGVKKTTACNKPNNERQRKIKRHKESQASISRTIYDDNRKRDLKRDKEHETVSKREHSIKITKEYANIATELENIGERLMAAVDKLKELDKDNLDTEDEKRMYVMRKEHVEHYKRAYNMLKATLKSLEEANSPNVKVAETSSPNAKVAETSFLNAKVAETSFPNAKVAEKSFPNAKVAEKSFPNAKVAEKSFLNAKVAKTNAPNAKVAETSGRCTDKRKRHFNDYSDLDCPPGFEKHKVCK